MHSEYVRHYCTLKKKARKTTAEHYIAERIHSIYAELGGLCAMMTLFNDGATKQRRSASVAACG